MQPRLRHLCKGIAYRTRLQGKPVSLLYAAIRNMKLYPIIDFLFIDLENYFLQENRKTIFVLVK